MSIQSNTKLIKNTLFLYIRMLLTLLVSLYTSRIILFELGVDDYGIYNVVGGVVSMFSVISGSLSSAISRFITFELGTGNIKNLTKVFSTSITIQFALSLFIIIIAESIGVWFLNNQINLPPNRLYAANWVFQFSLLTFIINLLSIPYNACIIAHEKMSAFAYISIVEASNKLLIAFLISISPIDNLIFYAILNFIIAIIIRSIYTIYCKRNFEECNYKFSFDKNQFKSMFGFAGWNLLGSSSFLLKDQGVNILLNIFFGPAINAARSISLQINNAITMFIANFMTALDPQITKSYAEGRKDITHNLILKGTKFSYLLLLCISTPVLLNIDFILSFWLKEVPIYTKEFATLILVLSLIDIIYRPLLTGHLATGNIKSLQIIVGGINLLILPISYIFLKLGFAPTITVYVTIFFSIIGLFIRIHLYNKIEDFPLHQYLTKVILRIVITSLIIFISTLIYKDLDKGSPTLLSTFISCCASFIYTLIISFTICINKKERKYIFKIIKNKVPLCSRKQENI